MAKEEKKGILEGEENNWTYSDPMTQDKGSYEFLENESTEDKDDKDSHRTGLLLTSFNYINSIVGSGIIGIPYAIRMAGFWMGLLLLSLIAILTDYSLTLLIEGGILCKAVSYQGLAQAALGKVGIIYLSILQFAYPFLCMVSYNVVVGDTVTKAIVRLSPVDLSNSVLRSRYLIIFIVNIFILLPLCLFRSVSRLTWLAAISLAGFAVLVVFFGIRLVTLGPYVHSTEPLLSFIRIDFGQTISIITFAFMCNHNSFLLYNTLKEPTQKRWNATTHISIFTSYLFCLIVGILGYLTFGSYTQGDLLENYCFHDVLINIGRFLYALNVLLTFPLEMFVCREVLERSFSTSGEGFSNFKQFGITILLLTSSMLASFITDCLGILLTVSGVLCAIPLTFILPPLCVLRVQPEKILKPANIPKIFLLIFGIAAVIGGFVLTIVYSSKYLTCSHGREMLYCRALNNPTQYISIPKVDNINNSSLSYNSTALKI